ncbi:DUF4296 domain-containing protein [Tenacibaculum tangerinum]|uniref:DUF4296 domain-containing protein n=1 Tax=Tenacibaculum tangerinum TaxID=3038772 RepID=A0ABY8L059_9FLAO|nr:DUF4296 domain-containing protein [Tenacibaculum tangerinum]WGH74858.1 DUF4296 domain-containing protein [Tenacibaculum tangerinum]
MKYFIYIGIGLFLLSCNSNTIYKKPKNLISKDSMIMLLTDMYIASSAKNQKNKFLKREKNYMILVYEKYKIDSTRFDASNTYYTSRVDEYSDILKKVKSNIDSLEATYRAIEDSIQGTKIIKKDSLIPAKEQELDEILEEPLERTTKKLDKKELERSR